MAASLPGNGSAPARPFLCGINIAVRSAGSRAALNAIMSPTWNRVAQNGRWIILPPIVARATQPTIKNLPLAPIPSGKPGRVSSLKCSIFECDCPRRAVRAVTGEYGRFCLSVHLHLCTLSIYLQCFMEAHE